MRSPTVRRFSLVSLLVACGAVGACATGIDGTLPLVDGIDDAGHRSNLGADGDDTLDVDATMIDGAPSTGDDEDATVGDDGPSPDGSREPQDARADAESDGGSHDAAEDAQDAQDATSDAADADAGDASDAADAGDSDADAATSACVTAAGFAAQGTPCTDNGGVLCDGAGSCTQTYSVVRVGSGASALDATTTATYIETYYPAAASSAINTTALPTAASAANQPLTLGGSATTEGALTRSANGSYLVLAGYASAPGASTTGPSRVVGRIGAISAMSAVDTSTTLDPTAFASSNVRGAASNDGSAFWVTGTSSSNSGGGVWYLALGTAAGGTHIDDTPNNMRTVDIFGGQLYISTGSGGTPGISAVGSGLPTTTMQTTTALPSLSTSDPLGFVLFDLESAVAGIDTAFVADSSSGVERWTFDGTSWTQDTAFTPLSSALGVTGWVTSTGVSLIATTTSKIVRLDVATLTPSVPTTTTLANAATHTAYRGVALAPH